MHKNAETSPKVTPLGRVRSAVDRFLRHPATDAAVMVLILLSVVLLLIEEYGSLRGRLGATIQCIGDALTYLFAVELSLRWWTAPSTRRHWQEYWLDWLGVLPALRPLRILRVLRVLRLLRLLRLYRFGAIAQRFVARADYRRFEQMLRDEVAHYRGRFASQIWLVPDLFRMLTNLLEDGRVDAPARRRIACCLAYFITPFELYPKELYGAEGYLDQVCLCLQTVKSLAEALPAHVLEEAWEGEGDILEIVARELPALEAELGPAGLQLMCKYLGLSSADREAAATAS